MGAGPNYVVIPHDWANLEHIIADLTTRFVNENTAFTDFLLKDGTRELTADWDAGSFKITAEQFESDIATGAAPLIVASTTVVTNLNADLLDGQHGSFYAPVSTGVIAAAALTDEKIVRGDVASLAVQTSGIGIDDTDNITGVTSLAVGNLRLGVLNASILSRVNNAGLSSILGSNTINTGAMLDFGGQSSPIGASIVLQYGRDAASNAADFFQLGHKTTGGLNAFWIIDNDQLSSYTGDWDITGAMDISGLTTLGGNLLVNGGDIGITGDTDLIQLANGALTVNGSITGTFVNITDDTNAYQINGEMILTNQGTQNISVGFKANITDPAAAIQNISIGSCAGEFLDNTAGVEATQNVFVGFEAGQGASAGTPNTGNSNVGLGFQALTSLTSGSSNVGLGTLAGWQITAGNNNFGLGKQALNALVTGSDNVGIGREALLNATASRNIGIGTKAGGKELQGVDNIYIGHNAGGISSPTTKFFNVVIGSKAATSLGSNCNSNIIIGYQAATALTTGDGNVFVGEEAGQIFTTGGANVMLGFEQGKTANGIITGVGDSNLLAIGNQDPVTNLPLIEGYFAAHASGPKLLINGACDIGDGTNETQISATGNITQAGSADATLNLTTSSTMTEWDAAYDNMVTAIAFNTGDGIITITQQDSGTLITDTLDGRYYTETEMGSTTDGSSGATLVGIAVGTGSPTIDQLQEYLDNTGSSGYFTGGELSDGGSGTLDVAAGEGFIRESANDNAPLLSFKWSASAGIAIPDNTTQYVFVDDAGTINLSTDEFDEAVDNIMLGVVTDEGGAISHTFNLGVRLEESIGQMGRYIRHVDDLVRNRRKGGLLFGESGDANRFVTLTEGQLEWGRTSYPIPAFNTAGADTFDTYSAGGQEATGVSAWPNTQYDNAGTLTTMINNRWAVLWWYIEPDGHIVLLYGRGQYVTEGQAEDETEPTSSIPNRLSSASVIASKFIFKKSEDTTAKIETAFGTPFTGSGVTAHGNLAGLGSDDHAQYLLADGSRALAGAWDMGNQNLTQVDINGGTLASITIDGAWTALGQTCADLGTVSAATSITSTAFVGPLTGNADTVTTNANLTGIVTSAGNATAIANKAIAIAKLADGTDGELITWSAAGVIDTVAVGTVGHVLTSNGVGVAPTFQAAAAAGANTALSNLAAVAINLSLVSDTDNTDALGTAAIGWSDLFLGNGSVITWSTAPSTADVTLTHAANLLTFAGGTIALGTATATGGLTGNVTGNCSGSSGSTTGNAATATALETARNIGGVSFDGTAAIVPTTIVVADTVDATCFVGLWESATGSLLPKTDLGITYNAATGQLTATGFTGPLTGNADTVTTNANLTGIVTSAGNATAIANKALAIAKLADGTDGELITWDASGVITTVGVGTDGQVLASNGAGAVPAFETKGFVDRGNAAASDFDENDGHTLDAWTDLDLGPGGLNIVPAGATAVVLYVAGISTTTNDRIMVRKNGSTSGFGGNVGAISMPVVNLWIINNVTIACDANAIVEYWLDTDVSFFDITVVGWFL